MLSARPWGPAARRGASATVARVIAYRRFMVENLSDPKPTDMETNGQCNAETRRGT